MQSDTRRPDGTTLAVLIELSLAGVIIGFGGPIAWTAFITTDWSLWQHAQNAHPLWFLGGACGLGTTLLAAVKVLRWDSDARTLRKVAGSVLGVVIYAGVWTTITMWGTSWILELWLLASACVILAAVVPVICAVQTGKPLPA